MPKNAIHIESGILTTLEEYKLEEAAGSPACARPTRAHRKLHEDEDKKAKAGTGTPRRTSARGGVLTSIGG